MTGSISSTSTEGISPQQANRGRVSTLMSQRHSSILQGLDSTEEDSGYYRVDLKEHGKWMSIRFSVRAARDRLKVLLETSGTLYFLEVLNTFLSVVSVALYIAETYFDDADGQGPVTLGYVVSAHVHDAFEDTDLAINIFFLLDFLLRVALAPSWVQFFFRWQVFVDFVTIFPPYARLIILAVEQSRATSSEGNQGYVSVSAQLNFFRIARVIRIIRLLKLTNTIGATAKNELQRQIFTEALVLLTLIFVFAGMFQVCENELVDSEKMHSLWGRHKLYFHDAVYFAIITMATVGYGDIYPISIPAKCIVVLGVVSSFAVISKQTNQLFTLLSVQSEFARNVYIPHTARTYHVIVCGHVCFDSARTLLTEFFHEDHGQRDTKMVFLCPDRPSFELLFLLRSPEYSTRTVYLEGSTFVEDDLVRAGCMRCQCVFVLSNKSTRDPKAEDFSTIMHAMAVRDFIKKNCTLEDVHIIMQLIRPENRHHFQSSIYGKAWLTQLVCVEEIKLHVIAKSCLVPGFTSFVSNLIRSSSSDMPENADEWLTEYGQGCNTEIYRTILSPNFCGKTFGQCAAVIYKDLKCTLFAIEIVDQDRQNRVVLNPASYQIPHTRATYAFLIAYDQETADKVSSWPDGTASPMKENSSEESMKEHSFEVPTHDHSPERREEKRSRHSSWHEQLNELDLNHIRRKFHCLEVPAGLSDVTIEGNAPPDTLRGHVLVCGNINALHHFVSTLRPKYLKRTRPIVIVHPDLEEESLEWRQLRYFIDIFYVKGSPLNNADLVRAGVNFLHTAVILSHDQDKTIENADADTVLTYHMIKKYNSKCKCVVEIMNPDNVNFMDRMQQQGGLMDDSASWRAFQTWRPKDPIYQPAYAAGIVYIDSVMDTLSCQCFYNIHLLTIIKLLVGTTDNSDAHFDQTVHSSELYCIRCPTALVGRTYGLVFHYLVTKMNSVPLGLYRDPPTNPSPDAPKMAYVLSNPKATLRMLSTDCIYALRNPNDENDVVGDLPAEDESEAVKPQKMTLKTLSKRILSGAEAGLEAGASAAQVLKRSFSSKRRVSLKAVRKEESLTQENEGKSTGQKILGALETGVFRRLASHDSGKLQIQGKSRTLDKAGIAVAKNTVDQVSESFFAGHRRGSDGMVLSPTRRHYTEAEVWDMPVSERSAATYLSVSHSTPELSETFSISPYQSHQPKRSSSSPLATSEPFEARGAKSMTEISAAADVADEESDPPAAAAAAAHPRIQVDNLVEGHRPAEVAAAREPSRSSKEAGLAANQLFVSRNVSGAARISEGGDEGGHRVDLQPSGDVHTRASTGQDAASS